MQAAPAREHAVLHYQRYGGFGLSYAWGRPPGQANAGHTKAAGFFFAHAQKKNPAALQHKVTSHFCPRAYHSLPSRSWAQYQGSGA